LEKTTISAGIIIQFFTYSLQIDELVFFQGQATFGYFPAVTMASQLGLDGGKSVLPWIRNNMPPQADGLAGLPPSGNGLLVTSLIPSSQPPLDHLDELVALPAAGRYDKGYLYARKRIHPDDWYFRCHFLDDPVMPGSLGIEAILKALREYAGKVYTSTGSAPVPRIHPVKTPLAWRYRGQIRPHQVLLELEVHITQVIDDASTVTVSGEASLWIDEIRIYEMSPASVTIPKGD
jgi:3-hydroxymyristoyl/3-hydroxydecanoyl-(acyl carrier protein) dehydratase